ncbi:hypothetical protein CFC21_074166 [Triticum aestivum]|uniref:Uncharacterized protein n=3 Tax=Triticum TaxID=4564 RepID=A0A9R0XKZ8_TRITD|nr:hypothetical protein CFC21_074166 [Triticum aestivum]VAI38400.1 unnamed protein product [Triticum turgidum subsp. durum]
MQLILNFLGLDTSWSSCALLFGWCRIPQLLPRGSSFEPDSFSSWSVARMELIAGLERKRSSNSLGSEKNKSSSSLEKERYSSRGQQQRAESAGQGRQQRIRSRDEFDSITIDNDSDLSLHHPCVTK